MKNAKCFGEIIKSYRKEKGLTVKEFISKLGGGITPAYVTQIEVYAKIPSPELVCKIADVIGYESETLLNIAKNNKVEDYLNLIEKKHTDALWLYRKQKNSK